jgi:hypothetical protein
LKEALLQGGGERRLGAETIRAEEDEEHGGALADELWMAVVVFDRARG